MRNILIALLALSLVAGLPACTSKGSNLVPFAAQQRTAQPVTPMDGNGGGPISGCGENGCPDPTPTP